jgi:hypothetical protein
MEDKSASQQIDDIITKHGVWKGNLLSRLRAVIKSADPDVVEDVKWKMPSRPEGLPVWSHGQILCIAEIFKNDIKLVFFKGAYMEELQAHFNTRLNSKTDRAIEFHEGDTVDEVVVKKLVREAVRLNTLKKGA